MQELLSKHSELFSAWQFNGKDVSDATDTVEMLHTTEKHTSALKNNILPKVAMVD